MTANAAQFGVQDYSSSWQQKNYRNLVKLDATSAVIEAKETFGAATTS